MPWIRKFQSILVNQWVDVGWNMVQFFFFSIDTIRWNALTLYVIKHGKTIRKTNAFDNRLDLITSLVKPFIAERPTVGLEIGLRNKISIILGRNADEAVEADCDVEYPRYANESNCVIFVYSISLVWSKRKRNTYWKSWNLVVRHVAILCVKNIQRWLVRSICSVFIFFAVFFFEWTLSTNRFIYIRLLVLFMFHILVCFLDFYNLKNHNKNHCSKFHKG